MSTLSSKPENCLQEKKRISSAKRLQICFLNNLKSPKKRFWKSTQIMCVSSSNLFSRKRLNPHHFLWFLLRMKTIKFISQVSVQIRNSSHFFRNQSLKKFKIPWTYLLTLTKKTWHPPDINCCHQIKMRQISSLIKLSSAEKLSFSARIQQLTSLLWFSNILKLFPRLPAKNLKKHKTLRHKFTHL